RLTEKIGCARPWRVHAEKCVFRRGSGSAAVLAQGRGGFQAPQGPQPTRAVPAPHFEYAGPVSAGRIAAAAAVAGKPGIYYAGAASRGAWESRAGGTTVR